MATARELHMKRMARLMDLGRMHLDGKTVRQIAEHYGFSTSYARMLIHQFKLVCVPQYINNKHINPFSKYMRKEELKELAHIKDWLEFLAKESK
jgi:hypothetical protein